MSARRSRFFKNAIPRLQHLVKGKKGVGGEVTDLRNDVDGTFVQYEEEGNLSKNNPNATVNPGVNDDSTQGYGVLSYWLNTVSNELFVCLDPSAGAAVWKSTTLTVVSTSIGSVKSKANSVPPPGPHAVGDRYIVNPPGAGLWSGRDNDLAEWNGSSWNFVTPDPGDKVWVEDETRNYQFNGTIWTFPESYLDHNEMQNLAVGDVHTQYQKESEKNAADGYAGLDAFGEVADTQHGSRSGGALHAAATPTTDGFMSSGDKGKLNGVAPGATNTPLSATVPVDVTKAAAAAGTATEAARQDHKHDVATGTPVNVGAANAEGTATSLARSDHAHNHGNLLGGLLHALATQLLNGFMSAADKLKLDGVAPGATNTPLSSAGPANVNRAAAAPGTANSASRGDHKHSVDTGVPSAVGTANAEGTGTSLARSDHVHSHGNLSGGLLHATASGAAAGFMSTTDKNKLDASGVLSSTAPVDVTKAGASAGSATEAARQDHKHNIVTAQPGSVLIGDSAAEGTSSSLARADHVHAVAAPAAPVNVTKATAAAGTATSSARADHKHDITTSTPVAIGASNQEGTSSALARADHVHAGAVGSSKVMLLWGNNSVSATVTTRYLNPGYTNSTAPTSPVQFRVPFAGTLRNFYLRQNSGAGNGNNIVYTVRVNGVATALTVTIASTANDASDLSNSVSVSQGDLVDIEVTKAVGVGSSPRDIVGTVELS